MSKTAIFPLSSDSASSAKRLTADDHATLSSVLFGPSMETIVNKMSEDMEMGIY